MIRLRRPCDAWGFYPQSVADAITSARSLNVGYRNQRQILRFAKDDKAQGVGAFAERYWLSTGNAGPVCAVLVC